ncbi:MAG: SDR family oxidoreductase [Desulfatitalea sp.]|nr:SDR family oxidoreductase [Desulfatitalea sp.]NNK01273.1 SDR family oxidoreductase [Desulfatitalea sp.]
MDKSSNAHQNAAEKAKTGATAKKAMFRLDNKVAIVTGGASGLGRAVVELFTEQGARAIIADINDARGAEVSEAVNALGGKALFIHTDVTQADDMRAVVQYAEQTYGRLDIMVANAGIVGTASTKILENVEEEEWGHIIDVNLNGVWRAFKYAAPAIRRAGGGAMTSTGSLSSRHIVSENFLGAYTASKFGALGLTAYFASELFGDDIRVNCVNPGGMLTNIYESAGWSPEQYAAWKKGLEDTLEQGNKAVFPVADPREVAMAHLFLCSDEASFITGQSIDADGGGFVKMFSAGARSVFGS